MSDQASRAAAIAEVVKHTTEQIAILGSVLLRNPCRDEILRTLSSLNKDFRALANRPERDFLGEYVDDPLSPERGDDIDIDAYEAAYRGHGPYHSVNRLIRAHRAARAEIERLKSREPKGETHDVQRQP